jgi:hypothetical protein
VFRVDRRLYRVDRWMLPVPGGVPLRGLGYFVAALGALVVAGRLPMVGSLVGALSPPLRYVVVPLGIAVLGTQAAPDGRVAHRFAWDWLRLRLRSRRRSAGRTVPLAGEPVSWHGELAMRWDERAPQLHGARVRGPARVTFAVPVRVVQRRGAVVVRPGAGGRTGDAVVVGARQTVEVRP